MKDFAAYLEEVEEIGYVDKIVHSIAYISGLPKAHPSEVILFENGDSGQVLSLSKDYVEVLLLSKKQLSVGTRVVRTNELFQIRVGDHLLGRIVDPLAHAMAGGSFPKSTKSDLRSIDKIPPSISSRINIGKPLTTGVSMIDLVVPLGKGQRELVIGDRKTGKTLFLLQSIRSAIKEGIICIYAVIGKKRVEIKQLQNYFSTHGINNNIVMVASAASDPAGLVFLTPYTAMTIAEYYKEQGKDTLVILDDMTTHAKYYREISLLARRFPGRSSYPGDIFYVHSKLMERAGNFLISLEDEKGKIYDKEVSISCLPIAQSVMGDLSGYIQTNLMSMTDGHIFFDGDLFDQGRRPAVNPFLSVTRVGLQVQTPLLRDLTRQLSSFLVNYEKMKQFTHFGAEVGQNVKNTLDLGGKVLAFFDQSPDDVIPLNLDIFIVGILWSGYWRETSVNEVKTQIAKIVEKYLSDNSFRQQIDSLVVGFDSFTILLTTLKEKVFDLMKFS